ncbi:MAG: hypothetical protein C0484_10600 [Rhodospirillum sp.]|nr:hypothetical protein [Rhodospirillum sp.]
MTHLERLSETRQEQRAAPQPAQLEVVGVLPVVAGDTIPLPFDPQGLRARLDSNRNLAIRSGARTYILQNYVAADLREDVTILADDGSEVDLPLVIAATGPEVVFPTAAGFGGAPTGRSSVRFAGSDSRPAQRTGTHRHDPGHGRQRHGPALRR